MEKKVQVESWPGSQLGSKDKLFQKWCRHYSPRDHNPEWGRVKTGPPRHTGGKLQPLARPAISTHGPTDSQGPLREPLFHLGCGPEPRESCMGEGRGVELEGAQWPISG